MLSIADGEALARALRSNLDHNVKRLLRLRCQQLGGDIDDQAHFGIVEPGDTPADLEEAIGFSIFRNPADGSRHGELDWQPGWEWIEDHGGLAWELCFIMDDSGYAYVVIIPKQNGVAPELLSLCAEYTPEHA